MTVNDEQRMDTRGNIGTPAQTDRAGGDRCDYVSVPSWTRYAFDFMDLFDDLLWSNNDKPWSEAVRQVAGVAQDPRPDPI